MVRGTPRRKLWTVGFIVAAAVAIAALWIVVTSLGAVVGAGSAVGPAITRVVIATVVIGAAAPFSIWALLRARSGVRARRQQFVDRPTARQILRRNRRSSFGAAFLLFLAVFGGPAVLFYFSILASEGYENSTAAQHGLQRTATVVRYQAISHSLRSGTYTTYDIFVTFEPPIDGATVIEVHTGMQTPPAAVASQIPIVVNPHRPTYAEVRGKPVHSFAEALVTFIGLVVLSLPLMLVLSIPLRRRMESKGRSALGDSESAPDRTEA